MFSTHQHYTRAKPRRVASRYNDKKDIRCSHCAVRVLAASYIPKELQIYNNGIQSSSPYFIAVSYVKQSRLNCGSNKRTDLKKITMSFKLSKD